VPRRHTPQHTPTHPSTPRHTSRPPADPPPVCHTCSPGGGDGRKAMAEAAIQFPSRTRSEVRLQQPAQRPHITPRGPGERRGSVVAAWSRGTPRCPHARRQTRDGAAEPTASRSARVGARAGDVPCGGGTHGTRGHASRRPRHSGRPTGLGRRPQQRGRSWSAAGRPGQGETGGFRRGKVSASRRLPWSGISHVTARRGPGPWAGVPPTAPHPSNGAVGPPPVRPAAGDARTDTPPPAP
jgi:hypothetical protein